MHPIDHYETLRRGHEELLRRAEYERMARKARVEQSRSKNTQKVANWLGRNLVSWVKNVSNWERSSRHDMQLQHDHRPCSAKS